MTQNHLLPANASSLEKALSLSMDGFSRLALSADAVREFKSNPADPLLPWLIWEYGLEELLPYLPDPRRAIAEGILWQRLRGTPAALVTALSWIGMRATIEQEPPGVHFAEFQIDPGQVLDSDQTIANSIAIARLSAPARSRLARIYHGYDLRRFVLDVSRLDEALLSDDSGIFWRDGKTKLSFGRRFVESASAAVQRVASDREATRFAVARLIDRYLLDFSNLGDPGHTRNEAILHAHLFTFANALGVPDPKSLRPERRFARAMLVLSDGPRLGDINARTARRTLFSTRPMPTLGDLRLGDGGEIEWRELTLMQIGLSGFTKVEPYGFSDTPTSLQRLLTQAAASNDASLANPSRRSLASASAAWKSQTWTGVRWPQSSWQDTRELIGSGHNHG